jgi:hypothetical protein
VAFICDVGVTKPLFIRSKATVLSRTGATTIPDLLISGRTGSVAEPPPGAASPHHPSRCDEVRLVHIVAYGLANADIRLVLDVAFIARFSFLGVDRIRNRYAVRIDASFVSLGRGAHDASVGGLRSSAPIAGLRTSVIG